MNLKNKTQKNMVLKIIILIITLGYYFMGSQALANRCDSDDFTVYDVGGFSLDQDETDIIPQNKFTEYSIQLGKKEIINKITKLIKSINPNPRGSESPKALAEDIYDASYAYGVDPIIFAAKVWQESGQFNVDVVADGGDTGLTQMTGDGLNEIKEQHKKIKSKHEGERKVGVALKALAEDYFGPKHVDDWMDWTISKTNAQKKADLVKSVPYALASGASLFKIYLAEYLGSYKKAISQFNGNGTSNYYGKVTDKAEELRNISIQCGFTEVEINNLNAICEVVGDEKQCIKLIQEIYPLSKNVKHYDI